MNNTYAICLSLSRLGFCVIPIREKTKKPAIDSWACYQKVPPTPDEIRDWFLGTLHQFAIVTGAVSGCVVIDCDSERAEEWADANLPPTPLMVRTKNGQHRYYRHPGVQVRNRARIHTGGAKIEIDVRGDGGYVMGPGALHMDGGEYVPSAGWREIFGPEGRGWNEVPVFDPAWIGGQPEQPKPQPQAPTPNEARDSQRADDFTRCAQYVGRIPGSGEGGRNHATSQVAYKIAWGFELRHEGGYQILSAWNQSQNSPALPDREVRQVWGSALKAQPPADPGWLRNADLPDRPERTEKAKDRPKQAPEEPQQQSTDQQDPVTYRERIDSERSTFERTVMCCCSASAAGAFWLEHVALADLTDAAAMDYYQATKGLLSDGIEPSMALVRGRLVEAAKLESANRYQEDFSRFDADRQPLSWIQSAVDELLAKSGRRRMQAYLRQATALERDTTITLAELQERLPRLLTEAMTFVRRSEPEPEKACSIRLAEQLLQQHMDEETGKSLPTIKTGFPELDDVLDGGLFRFEFVVLAGGTGSGKSSFALQMAHGFAKQGPCYVYTGEMSKTENVKRAAAQAFRKKASQLTAAEIYRYEEMASDVYYDDEAPMTIERLGITMQRFLLAHPDTSAAVIDYIGLMAGRDRYADINLISVSLKRLARNLQIPIIGIHMINDDVHKRDNKVPQLNDLRDSKQLGYDADRVIFMHRPSVYDKNAPEDRAELWFRKNRHGRNNIKIAYKFDGPCYRFDPAPKPKILNHREERQGPPLPDLGMEDIVF